MTLAQEKLYKELSSIILKAYSASPLLVAINGNDASGKTIMADALAEYLRKVSDREIIRISIDDFMNERSVRYTPSVSQGKGCYDHTFNFEAFKQYVLLPLQSDGSMTYKTKIFDHPSDTSDVSSDKIADLDSIVIDRGAIRDEQRLGSYEIAKQKYIDRYIASQKIYYSKEEPEESADFIIDNNDFESPFIKE